MSTSVTPYDPQEQYAVRAYDVTYRQDQDGAWLARIYQPQGPGPFPAVIDVHGGAWSRGSYTDNERLDQSFAASGLLVVAITCRQSPRYPYPAQVADVNYGVRWLKAHAADFNADARCLGGLGTSSGGHTILLSTMRPCDPRYTSLPLPEASAVDATLSYVLLGWPVVDSYARYVFAQETGRAPLVEATQGYFLTTEAMQEGNPLMALERGERVEMPPLYIVQGSADDNVPVAAAHRFVELYRAAGGAVEMELFPDMPHGFARSASAPSDRALALMKAFLARQLAVAKAAV